jgi:hypothetical protein
MVGTKERLVKVGNPANAPYHHLGMSVAKITAPLIPLSMVLIAAAN